VTDHFLAVIMLRFLQPDKSRRPLAVRKRITANGNIPGTSAVFLIAAINGRVMGIKNQPANLSIRGECFFETFSTAPFERIPAKKPAK